MVRNKENIVQTRKACVSNVTSSTPQDLPREWWWINVVEVDGGVVVATHT